MDIPIDVRTLHSSRLRLFSLLTHIFLDHSLISIVFRVHQGKPCPGWRDSVVCPLLLYFIVLADTRYIKNTVFLRISNGYTYNLCRTWRRRKTYVYRKRYYYGCVYVKTRVVARSVLCLQGIFFLKKFRVSFSYIYIYNVSEWNRAVKESGDRGFFCSHGVRQLPSQCSGIRIYIYITTIW